MINLYKYTGSIGSFMGEKVLSGKAIDMTLYNMHDDSIAPTRIQAYGGIASYLLNLEGTDDEERYLEWNFFYTHILTLSYIEIPAEDGKIPAKIIINDDAERLKIFGISEHINTDKPEPMTAEQYQEWMTYKYEHSLNNY